MTTISPEDRAAKTAWCVEPQIDGRTPLLEDFIRGFIAGLAHARQESEARVKELLDKVNGGLVKITEACLCERFKTKGFDYHETHKRLGKAGDGRWLTPRDLVFCLQRDIEAITQEPKP